MYIENISPVIITLGPLAIRWYGLMFALSVLIGYLNMRKHGQKIGFNEDFILNLFVILIFAIVVGARLVYVVTNWPFFLERPDLVVRIDQGGLAFHGGLLGGVLGSWLYCRFKQADWQALADLAVPGIAVGIMLVRIANIFNQEILGRPVEHFIFERHPAQLYGSLIGLILLMLHNYLTRRPGLKAGFLFWSFIFAYSFLRGLLEETFRENPLVAWGYINPDWGAGFFTAVQVITPFLLVFSLLMLRKIGYDPK